jgi:hypothetical protein
MGEQKQRRAGRIIPPEALKIMLKTHNQAYASVRLLCEQELASHKLPVAQRTDFAFLKAWLALHWGGDAGINAMRAAYIKRTHEIG